MIKLFPTIEIPLRGGSCWTGGFSDARTLFWYFMHGKGKDGGFRLVRKV